MGWYDLVVLVCLLAWIVPILLPSIILGKLLFWMNYTLYSASTYFTTNFRVICGVRRWSSMFLWAFSSQGLYTMSSGICQLPVERLMMGMSLRDHLQKDGVRRRTSLRDVVWCIVAYNSSFTGHVARQDATRWTKRIDHWRPSV